MRTATPLTNTLPSSPLRVVKRTIWWQNFWRWDTIRSELLYIYPKPLLYYAETLNPFCIYARLVPLSLCVSHAASGNHRCHVSARKRAHSRRCRRAAAEFISFNSPLCGRSVPLMAIKINKLRSDDVCNFV
jgi:hypothetical protein